MSNYASDNFRKKISLTIYIAAYTIKPPIRWFYCCVKRDDIMINKKNQLEQQAEELKKIREMAGMNRREFSEHVGIPLRNLEEWEAARRKMPEYLLRMLKYYITVDRYLEEKNLKEEVKGREEIERNNNV